MSDDVEAVARTTLRRRRGRKKLAAAALVVFVFVVVAGVLLLRYFASYESTDDAQVDAHLYPVSPRVSGHVLKVNANDNQYVNAGTVLVEIDPKDYRVAV